MTALAEATVADLVTRCGICNQLFKGRPGSDTELRAQIRSHISQTHQQLEPAIWICEPRWQSGNCVEAWIRYGSGKTEETIIIKDYLKPDQLQVDAEELSWRGAASIIRNPDDMANGIAQRIAVDAPDILDFTLRNGKAERRFNLRLQCLRPAIIADVSSIFSDLAGVTNADTEFLQRCESLDHRDHETDYVESLYRFIMWCNLKKTADLNQMHSRFEKITHFAIPLQMCIEDFMSCLKLNTTTESSLRTALNGKHSPGNVRSLIAYFQKMKSMSM